MDDGGAIASSSDHTDDDSDGSGGFRMFTGASMQHVHSAPGISSTSAPRVTMRNLVDFSECNQPTSPPAGGRNSWSGGESTAASSSRFLSPPSPTLPSPPPPPPPSHQKRDVGQYVGGFSTPMQSKDDVLLEEIRYLRQMLADCNEEKRIQIAIVRDELTDKQRTIEQLSRHGMQSEMWFRSTHDELDRISGQSAASNSAALAQSAAHEMLDKQRKDLDIREEELSRSKPAQQARERHLLNQLKQSEKQCQLLSAELDASGKQSREVERNSLELRRKLAAKEDELQKSRFRLAWWEASEEALEATPTESEVVKWERDFWESSQRSLKRLTDRRLELRVAAATAQATTAAADSMSCKICYDAPVTCALLPCRHHAFCIPCSRRVESSREPQCPLCRTPVTGVFETYAG